jgi:hypothetical protein
MKRKSRRGGFLLALAIFAVGAIALWFFWPELSWRLGWDGKKAPPGRASGESREKLYEDDRRRLDELLKQRQSK